MRRKLTSILLGMAFIIILCGCTMARGSDRGKNWTSEDVSADSVLTERFDRLEDREIPRPVVEACEVTRLREKESELLDYEVMLQKREIQRLEGERVPELYREIFAAYEEERRNFCPIRRGIERSWKRILSRKIMAPMTMSLPALIIWMKGLWVFM